MVVYSRAWKYLLSLETSSNIGAFRRSILAANNSIQRSGLMNGSPTGNHSDVSSCKLLLDDGDLTDGKIPQLLGLCLAAWLVLTVVFLIIRYVASDYSRAGLATSSQYMISLSSRSKLEDSTKERSLSLSTMLYEDSGSFRTLTTGWRRYITLSKSQLLSPSNFPIHWYTWFIHFFYKLKFNDIRHRCGPDATLYLSLHAYIIVLLCVISFLSIGIILPVNYLSGTLAANGFPKTTITNIDPSSGVLWLHTLFSLLYLVITFLFMLHYSLQLGKHQPDYSEHSVMVQWIPSYVHREDILQHLQEACPSSTLADVQMAYDISHLHHLSQDLKNVIVKIDAVDSLRNELGIRDTVREGWKKICCCIKSFNLDAKVYYEEKHQSLRAQIEREQEAVKDYKRLGIGFFTFHQENDAKKFCDSYKQCRRHPRSSVYDDVQAGRWWVSTAPFPADVIWENLSLPYIVWWMRWILINAFLFLFVFFFTTPTILSTSVDELRELFSNTTHIPDITQLNISSSVNPLVKIFFPSLLLLLFSSLLPLLVSHSCYLEAHWTKSLREQTMMRKTYIFLLLMIIILPSVGLASLNALAEIAREKSIDNFIHDRLRCAYLPNSGAFFIGYILITTLIGTSVKLLRLPELFLYCIRRLTARTNLQKEFALRKAANFEFKYGIEYAWNLVLFNMIMSFSLTTPLITPFGVLYFVLTYYTDRYNIYYVYKCAPFNGRQFLHRSAINFVIFGALHLQLATLFFSVIRLGQVDPRSIIMMVTFALTCLICIGIMFFGWFKHLLPRLRLKLGKDYELFSSASSESPESLNTAEDSSEVITKGAYIPKVLRASPSFESPSDLSYRNFGYQSFGSTDRMGRKSSSTSPTDPHHLSSTVATQKQSSTLERCAKKLKGGAGAGTNESASAKKDDVSPKSFV